RAANLNRRGLPRCEPGSVRHVQLAMRRSRRDADTRAALAAALRGLPDLPTRLRDACTATVPVVVPLGTNRRPGRVAPPAGASAWRGTTMARLVLRCDPS